MKTFVFTFWDQFNEINQCITDSRFQTLRELENFINGQPKSGILHFEKGSLNLSEFYGYGCSEAAKLQTLEDWVSSHTDYFKD